MISAQVLCYCCATALSSKQPVSAAPLHPALEAFLILLLPNTKCIIPITFTRGIVPVEQYERAKGSWSVHMLRIGDSGVSPVVLVMEYRHAPTHTCRLDRYDRHQTFLAETLYCLRQTMRANNNNKIEARRP